MLVPELNVRVVRILRGRRFRRINLRWCWRTMDFVGEFVLRLGKLADGLAHAAGEFGKFLGPEQKQDDAHDDDEIGPAEI